MIFLAVCMINNRRIALTNKLFSYILGGVPCLASDIPAHLRIAPELGEAMRLFPESDAEALAGLLDWFLYNADRLAQTRLGTRTESVQLGQAESSMAGDDSRSEHLLEDLLKSIIRRTPYRVIRARHANRFSAIEQSPVTIDGHCVGMTAGGPRYRTAKQYQKCAAV